MSIEEVPRKKKEKESAAKPDINSWLDNLDLELVDKSDPTKKIVEVEPKPITKADILLEEKQKIIKDKIETKLPVIAEKPQNIERTTTEVEIITKLQQFQANLPAWIKKPWMYVKPSHETQLTSWLDSWQNVFIKYTRTLQIHMLNLTEIRNIHPFTNEKNSKSLTTDHIESILDSMVVEGTAKWMDTSKILVRILYKTNNEWAEEIMDYFVNTGYAAEVLTLYEIEKMDKEWSSIPRNELVIIFDILVESDRASWVGNEKDTLTFIL